MSQRPVPEHLKHRIAQVRPKKPIRGTTECEYCGNNRYYTIYYAFNFFWGRHVYRQKNCRILEAMMEGPV